MNLLGGLTADAFMKRVWQRKPWLARGALAQPPLIDRGTLFGLAARDDVESRVVTLSDRRWTLMHGPFPRRALPALEQRAWTLLVQGVDLHHDAAHALLQHFTFLPWARLDDVMVSFATDGGGVGPHTDDYDVFLLQVEGQRRWGVGPVAQPQWRANTPLKQLRGFVPAQTWTLDPGDMLYVPPGWGHDGVALGSCITASIGFRAPRAGELARELLSRMVDDVDIDDPSAHGAQARRRYRDAGSKPSDSPGAIPAAMTRFAAQSVRDAVRANDALALAMGEWLTEPKAQVSFDTRKPRAARTAAVDIVLDRRTRMLYDARFVFINGDAFEVAGDDAIVLRGLADTRRLPHAQKRRLSTGARKTMSAWIAAGWMHTDSKVIP